MRLAHIAAPTSPNRHRPTSTSAHGIHDIILENHAGREGSIRVTLAIPAQLAVVGIETPDLVGDRDNQFGPITDFREDRSAPPGAVTLGRRAPHLATAGRIECEDGLTFDAGRHDHEVCVKEETGSRTEAVRSGILGDLSSPGELAVKVVSHDTGSAEDRVDALTVRDGGVRRIAVVWKADATHGLFRKIRIVGTIPADLSVALVDADNVTTQAGHFAEILPALTIAGKTSHENIAR